MILNSLSDGYTKGMSADIRLPAFETEPENGSVIAYMMQGKEKKVNLVTKI